MLATLDWIIIIGFFVLIVGVGLSYTRAAGKNLSSFFLGNRNLPWYIAGISMVATTFAADTPLAVTELVGQSGIAGNWLWWCFLSGGMLTTFFFARLWRKAGVLTEIELIELRYSGAPARFLRGFKSVYLGLFMNVIIIAWVNLALMTLLEVFFGMTASTALLYTGGAMLLVATYASLSGLLGIAITDTIQFVVAMVACIILAVIVVGSEEIGGISGLKASLPEGTLNFLPAINAGGEADAVGLGKTLGLSLAAFFAYAGIQWWASWYPGSEPGGGGYVAQRMMSTRTEKGAIYATLFFQIAHYCLRPWPWILIGLCAISLYSIDRNIPDPTVREHIANLQAEYQFDEGLIAVTPAELEARANEDASLRPVVPELLRLQETFGEDAPRVVQSLRYEQDTRKGFVYAMRDFLPVGLKGLLLVAFFAAYMSTISTQLNWGASYLINDLYKRFLVPKATDRHLVNASRISTLLLMALGFFVTTQLDSISGAWAFIMQCGAGLGLVLILRWYWWRINAWSEISATLAPFVVMAVLYALDAPFFDTFPNAFLLTVGVTTVVWIVVTWMTSPTNQTTLQRFYDKVQPNGAWQPFRTATVATNGQRRQLFQLVICWLSAIVMTYGILFLMGKLIFREWQDVLILIVVVLVSFVILRIFVQRTKVFGE